MKICKVEGCNGKHYAKGYCQKHYSQMKKYGRILTRTVYDSNEIIEYEDYAEIVLYDKYGVEMERALIDLDDIDKCKDYKWHLKSKTSKYVEAIYNGTKIALHHYILGFRYEQDYIVVDHINHNPLDNRKENLRICTQQENIFNSSKGANNTSGIRGVTYKKADNLWVAQLMINGQTLYKSFKSKEQAIEQRLAWEKEFYGEYQNKEDLDI